MAHNIVLLNLGDKAAGGGLIKKSADSLKQKKKYDTTKRFLFAANEVTEFSLFALFAQFGGGGLTRADAVLNQVRGLCNNATKIMLCMHGLHNDVQSGFANDTLNHAPMAAVATWSQLSEFMLALLPGREKEYNLALIMCYGARSENFRLDHEGMIPQADLKTSFAYKFYRRICMFRNVRMTARTGATGFDTQTGRSTVESEAAVQARADREDYLRDANTLGAIAAFTTLKDTYTKSAHGGSEARAKLWGPMEMKFRMNPDAVAVGADETIIRAYFQVVKIKNEYAAMMDGQDKTKYGKYVYKYSDKTHELTIMSKYPPPGTVLYQGALL